MSGVVFLDDPHGHGVGLKKLANFFEHFTGNLVGIKTVNERAGNLGEDGLPLVGEMLLELHLAGTSDGQFLVVLTDTADKNVGLDARETQHQHRQTAEGKTDRDKREVPAVLIADEPIQNRDCQCAKVEFGAQCPIP